MNLYAASKPSPIGRILPAAVSILPLAVLACMANPALADPITLSSPTCSPYGSGACTATVINAPAGNSLSATVTSPIASTSNGASASVAQFSVSANASGQLQSAQNVTFAYDFTVNRISLGGHSLNYSLVFGVVDSGCSGKGASCSFQVSGLIPTGTGAYQVTGSQAFTLPAGSLSSESLFLQIADISANNSSYSITSATLTGTGGTIPLATTVTPEPASLLLAGTGMALAALRRRRRKSA